MGQINADTAKPKQVIPIYKLKCVDCTYLSPAGTKTWQKCHFSKGNPMCPARDYVLAVGFEPTLYAKRYVAAEVSGDTVRLRQILDKLDSQPEQIQTVFWQTHAELFVNEVTVEGDEDEDAEADASDAGAGEDPEAAGGVAPAAAAGGEDDDEDDTAGWQDDKDGA